jgi:hypothetical protein
LLIFCHTLPHGSHQQPIFQGEIAMKKTKTEKKISKVYNEFKAGKLHSGKGGPVVKSKAQGLAIALSSAGVKPKKGMK